MKNNKYKSTRINGGWLGSSEGQAIGMEIRESLKVYIVNQFFPFLLKLVGYSTVAEKPL